MTRTKKITAISKSSFMAADQCPKALWLKYHRKDLIPEVTPEKQKVFDTGHLVGELACKLLPEGMMVEGGHRDIDKGVESTKKLVDSGTSVLFEAVAKADNGIYALADILRKNPDDPEGRTWDIIEVKATNSVKKEHLLDTAIQRLCFEESGYKINKTYLCHLNSQYYKDGELELDKLFKLTETTNEVEKVKKQCPNLLESALNAVNQEKEIKAAIGSRCNNPYECDFKEYCWKDVPELSVYKLMSKGKKLDHFVSKKQIALEDIDETTLPKGQELTENQAFYLNALRDKLEIVEKDKIKEYLSDFEFPLYFFDYETINSAIPLFNNSHPYQQVPFQYSLHILQSDGSIEHFEYLADPKSDPRPNLLKDLKSQVGDTGSVVSYNKGFEIGVNNGLSKFDPSYQSFLESINERMLDLEDPFKDKILYSYKQGTRTSIKVTLPAFVPELSYKDLEVNNGEQASGLFLECAEGKKELSDQLKHHFLEYCKLDTLAMVRLYEFLKTVS